ncbi:MAG: transposase [Microlunatus sp.]|nr:transposase [Microlunatus sp.]
MGLAPSRTGSCVKDWLSEQTPEFRAAIRTVVIDPSAPYASGIRAALPNAVDKWHLVVLAHTMVTEVRQRVTRDHLGRRGTTADPVWVNRRMLLAQSQPSKIRWALADFYGAVADAHLSEATRLASTIERWWPAVLVALTKASQMPGPRGSTGSSNRPSGPAAASPNMINYQRRILTHIAVTRPRIANSING